MVLAVEAQAEIGENMHSNLTEERYMLFLSFGFRLVDEMKR